MSTSWSGTGTGAVEVLPASVMQLLTQHPVLPACAPQVIWNSGMRDELVELLAAQRKAVDLEALRNHSYSAIQDELQVGAGRRWRPYGLHCVVVEWCQACLCCGMLAAAVYDHGGGATAGAEHLPLGCSAPRCGPL